MGRQKSSRLMRIAGVGDLDSGAVLPIEFQASCAVGYCHLRTRGSLAPMPFHSTKQLERKRAIGLISSGHFAPRIRGLELLLLQRQFECDVVLVDIAHIGDRFLPYIFCHQ